MTALRALLAGIVDYAGLFPPAALSIPAAVAEYAARLRSPEAMMLGRFVAGARHLPQLALAASPYLPKSGRSGAWRISTVLGEDLALDLREVERFNAGEAVRAVVDAVERSASTVDATHRLLDAIPGGLTAYVEVALEPDPLPLLTAIASRGARAKVRTGGLSADAVPTPASLARFLAACASLRVPFKATAGLHHPVRSEQAFSYAADSPRGVMHGFLNVFAAAVLLREGRIDVVGAEALLREERPQAFAFEGNTLRVGASTLNEREIESARKGFAMSFGSCSFADPVRELHALGLHPETAVA